MTIALKTMKAEPGLAPPSEAEVEARRNLAACYRLVAHFGWDDLLATHLSAKVPGEEAFLINPLGLMFDEITASSLVKIDLDGNILQPTPYGVNRAGFVIHSAVHAARADAMCVMHLHTRDGVAVAGTATGLLPLNQTAMIVRETLGFHDYEGVAVKEEERARLAADLGDNKLMLLYNHGTLSVGASIAEAFLQIYMLEWACTVQVRTLSMGQPLHPAAAEVVAETGARFGLHNPAAAQGYARDLVWPALLRKIDRVSPGYAD